MLIHTLPLVVVLLVWVAALAVPRTVGAAPTPYRLGQPFTYRPMLFTATGESVTNGHHAADPATAGSLIGGSAHGNW